MDSRVQTCDITHPLHGVVQDVDNHAYKWYKNGAWYYCHEGWSRVPQLQWVDVTGECVINTYQAITHNGNVTQDHPYRRSMRDGHIIIEKEEIIE